MSYKEIKLRANTPEAANTEVMYEIAACRADNIDLIRIDIVCDGTQNEKYNSKRIIHSIIKLLRDMKGKGKIQFFADAEDFRILSTEAVFLQNKYPSLFSAAPEGKIGEALLYVKL